MSKIISVIGPTATGKTALSVALAKHFEGEVVSVDSMQIYKGMDVGTAKVTSEEQKGIEHHMIDVLEPFESCNVRKFVTMARTCVDDVLSRGKRCILAGGTGLYVDHLIADTHFVDIPQDDALRKHLNSKTSEELYEMLGEMDEDMYRRLHVNDKKRVVRALEIITLTGKSIAYWDEISHQNSKPLDVIMIGLNFADREQLYNRINRRVDKMFEQGLVNEVKSLSQIDGFMDSTASDGIGYKEVLEYFDGSLSLEEVKEKIKLNTRRYAKRQLTWFRRNSNVHWINLSVDTEFERIFNFALQIIERND